MNDAGKICITPKGEYNASTQYEFLDGVYDGINSYIAKQDSIGQNPSTSPTYWQILAKGAKVVYGTSNTAGATAAKTVTTLSGDYNLEQGTPIVIKFANTDTSTGATLNIDGSGAKAIYQNGAAIKTKTLKEDCTYLFIYDGTNYVLVGGGGSGVEIPYYDTQAEADAAIANGDLDDGDYYAVGEDSLYHMEYDAENETLIVSDSLISYDSETETVTFNI